MAAALAALSWLLFGCAEKQSDVLKIYNWADNLDVSILKDFEAAYEQETGKKIKVIYGFYEDHNKAYDEIKKQKVDHDLMMMMTYEASVMANDGLLLPLDHSKLAPFSDYYPWLINTPSDPENMYTVPYSYGTVGIMYNPTHPKVKREEMGSWAALWNKKFDKKILINGADNHGLYLVSAFYTYLVDLQEASVQYTYPPKYKMLLSSIVQNTSPKALKEVSRSLAQQRQLIHRYSGNEAKYEMIDDADYDLGLFLSSDAIFAMQQNRALEYVVPREGSFGFVNCWCIPKYSQNPDAAHAFLKFIADKNIAKRNMLVSGTPSAVMSASKEYRQELEKDDKFFANDSPEWKEQYINTFFLSEFDRNRCALRAFAVNQYDVIEWVIQSVKDMKVDTKK
jgi:spermidine/putrescine transport system substrate-binding protein